jgi:hypothetical protein
MRKAIDVAHVRSQIMRKSKIYNVACGVLSAFWSKLELIRHAA